MLLNTECVLKVIICLFRFKILKYQTLIFDNRDFLFLLFTSFYFDLDAFDENLNKAAQKKR